MPYFSCIQKLLDKIALIARENLKGVRVIRAFSNQNHEVKRFNLETKNQKDKQVKVGKIQALLNPFTYLIVNFAIIIIIYASGFQMFYQSTIKLQQVIKEFLKYLKQHHK